MLLIRIASNDRRSIELLVNIVVGDWFRVVICGCSESASQRLVNIQCIEHESGANKGKRSFPK